MTKKIFLALLLSLGVGASAKAQFAAGTTYVGASLSGLNLNYSEKTSLRVGLNAEGGYFVDDCWMWRGNFNFNHTGKGEDSFAIGTGLRYSFIDNGINLATGVEFAHKSPNINDFRVPLEVGYTFFLNGSVAIESALYYKLSINDVAKGSEVGLRIGLGYYF